jgi:hypothetical protein
LHFNSQKPDFRAIYSPGYLPQFQKIFSGAGSALK